MEHTRKLHTWGGFLLLLVLLAAASTSAAQQLQVVPYFGATFHGSDKIFGFLITLAVKLGNDKPCGQTHLRYD